MWLFARIAVQYKNTSNLDDNYPRALQWCSTEEQPIDLVNIDISKCYPSILLNNNTQIPVYMYTVHDQIEQFSSRYDLDKCGEFYIDETITENYGVPLKIEAGFYGTDLVWYLLIDLYMPTANIKYKIVTKNALRPDTLNDFFLNFFESFHDADAKKLANSFIGEIGRKYARTDHGFM